MPNIEELLRRAIEEGKFDDLPGKGKPLHIDEANPHADPDWELAYRMLRDAGYSLPWIESFREIEADLASARNELRNAWVTYRSSISDPQRSQSATANWERSQLEFKNKLAELNKRIRATNLQVPFSRFQRQGLNFTRELQELTSQSA